MNNTIVKSIETLANKAVGDAKSDEALRFTQAALNLAHVEQVRIQVLLSEKELNKK